ncbi:MAG TPA: TldD/PmbA family protein [Syntrophomonadaceae bacterium]|nr:TldD/PmbA family protein [Syntrophomonadaceae bacterium]
METYFRNIGEKVMQTARRVGVEAEAFLISGRELSIEVRDGKVETLKQAEEQGLGVRIISHQRSGFAYTSDLSPAVVKATVADAVNMSRFSSPYECNNLPYGDYVYKPVALYDKGIDNASLEEKMELAREVERQARALDKKITIIEQAAYEEGSYSTTVMNTQDLYAFKQGNLCSISIALVAEEDSDAQNGFSAMIRRRFDQLSAPSTGREAAEKAVQQLGAAPIPSGNMPCIFDPYVTTRFLSIIASMADADAVQKGRSLLAGQIGNQIASSQCTIIDDSLLLDGIGSTPFDGEGVPGKRNLIAEKGVLKDYLYDHYTASRAGRLSTGNARRPSFRTLPAVGVSNLILQAGGNKPHDLIASIERGLYVTEVMGMHTVNPVSGQFSVGAAGLLIRNGSLDQPVRGVTIAGNILDLFRKIDALGDDLRFFGSRGAPSIRIENLSVGGR